MSTVPHAPADTAEHLLNALERTGPKPVLAWYGEAARIELSGHVLANWVIKAIGHLADEIALEPGDTVVIDLAPHWKRLVLALASWSLGAEVTVRDRSEGPDPEESDSEGPGPEQPRPEEPGPEQPRVVITDRPGSALAEAADEVLAVQALSLAPRFDGALPPLVHDWLAEVRGSSDLLGVALPAWSGPAPLPPEHGEVPPRLLVHGDGLAARGQVLGALLAGGGFVGPARAVSARQAQEESVTGSV